MREGEGLDRKASVVSGAALREVWRHLDALPKYTTSPSPSEVAILASGMSSKDINDLRAAFDPEVGITTSHGVW